MIYQREDFTELRRESHGNHALFSPGRFYGL
jgi:hypothetical protein